MCDVGEDIFAIEYLVGFEADELADGEQRRVGDAMRLGDREVSVADDRVSVDFVAKLWRKLEEKRLCNAARQRFLLSFLFGAEIHVVACAGCAMLTKDLTCGSRRSGT